MTAVALVLIFWQARRVRLQRTYQPPVAAPLTSARPYAVQQP